MLLPLAKTLITPAVISHQEAESSETFAGHRGREGAEGTEDENCEGDPRKETSLAVFVVKREQG